MDRRDKLARIFQDTRNLYQTNPKLRAAVSASAAGARLYLPDEPLELPASEGFATRVTVSGARTFEAAKRLRDEYPAGRVGVLNFASATNPGGGVVHGSTAQEESLCRCSTLYPTLDQRRFWDGYYHYHRERGDIRYSDACIFSPGITVFKNDGEYPELMPESDWFEVDVITCAAPNLRFAPFFGIFSSRGDNAQTVSDEELYRLHVSRGRRICEVAAVNGITVLLLGAFGCGAFCNDPHVVARAYEQVLTEMGSRFERIEFAIFCAPGRESKNLNAFRAVFSA